MAHTVRIDIKTGKVLEVVPTGRFAESVNWEPLIEILYEEVKEKRE